MPDAPSHPEFPPGPFPELTRAFEAGGVAALLIGGHALQAFGLARQTFDVDLLVSESDDAAVRRALESLGYRWQASTSVVHRFRHPDPSRPDIDLLPVDPTTFAKLSRDSRNLAPEAATSALRIPGLPHLIALKMHAISQDRRRREHDLADIVELARRHPETLPMETLAALAAAFGPPDLQDTIREALDAHSA